jgi:PTH2 family peptidyl-tRNA hydrolase
MKAIVEKCKHYGVPFGLQTDLGYTEVVEGTVTALAVGPAPETLVDLITKRLRLLKS